MEGDNLHSMYSNALVKLPEMDDFIKTGELKTMVFLFDTPLEELSNDLELMLANLIRALGLTKDDISYKHITKQFPISALKDSNVKNIVSFGISPEQLSLQVSPKHHVVNRFLSFSLVFSYSLNELSIHPEKKRELWVALKEQFEVQ